MFVALENDLPVLETAENVEKEMAASYLDKLKLELGATLPDPFNFWLKEEEGIKFWPFEKFLKN